MRFKCFIITILSAIFTFSFVYAQTQRDNTTNFAPKRELRGVWVATVANIDWPSTPGLTTIEQQNEFIKILDFHHRNGINAIFFQVRPAADAFYAQAKEPWSYWLSGTQGKAPLPAYDPLAFAIQEAHKRGMELHAWFNPYRATNEPTAKVAQNHISRLHPEWMIRYGGKLQFDPGLPQVQDYIVSVIMDVVKRYEIDGVHFDDYFYPYPVAGQYFNDRATFNKYGNGFANIEDWRRNNVDMLIKRLNTEIHQQKRWIKFGISPFGIWKNKTQDPEGSDTRGLSNYFQLFADSKKWIQNGWVDYINPQLYFTFDFKAAPFGTLMDWWTEHRYNRHLYIGLAAYRINEPRNRSWRTRTEMPSQIQYMRDSEQVQGAVFFSSKSLQRNPLGISDSLRNHYYKYPSLPPTMKWLDSIAPYEPQNVRCRYIGHGVQVTWSVPKTAPDKEDVFGYVVYRFDENEEVDKQRADKIKFITYQKSECAFMDNTVEKGKSYFYMITALDHLKNESEESVAVGIDVE